MTEAHRAYIHGIASILNVTDKVIIRKGVELVARLSLKPHISCSATCKGVICLDLASSFTPHPINKEKAVKYSGCKRRQYINMFNHISKLLNLDKVYTVNEICLLMNVCDIKDQAVKLLEKFKVQCHKVHYDFEHPMYCCAAVWATCRKNKIKIDHSRLVEFSRVKKSQLDELTKKFEDFLEIKETKEKPTKKEQKAKKTLKCDPEPITKTCNFPRKRQQTSGIMTDEEFMEWKKRMLGDDSN